MAADDSTLTRAEVMTARGYDVPSAPVGVVVVECSGCLSDFEAEDRRSRYCSDECRETARRERVALAAERRRVAAGPVGVTELAELAPVIEVAEPLALRLAPPPEAGPEAAAAAAVDALACELLDAAHRRALMALRTARPARLDAPYPATRRWRR